MHEEQWNLKAIHLPQEREENQDEIKVAVLDSGVSFDKDVPMESNIAISDVLESENVMFDDASGHGTGIAGMIAAQDNEDRIRGIHPEAKVYSIRVLNENNQATLSQVIAGIYKAIDLDCLISKKQSRCIQKWKIFMWKKSWIIRKSRRITGKQKHMTK